jgi:hypothetical protein
VLPAVSLLVPSLADLAGWAGALFAALVFLGLGRLLAQSRIAVEIALVAGWGGACCALTLWGIVTPASLRIPALALALLGAAGLVMPATRLGASEWLALLRIFAVALPLLLVMASAQPSQPDTFYNLLPNAAYLGDHGFFPADDRPPAYSYIAGAPYNMQLASFIATQMTVHFPSNAMIALNLIFQIAIGLLLARLVAGSETEPQGAPGWSSCAIGFLLALALNPGFVPRYDLSAYSEASVTVAVAVAGWLAAQILDRVARGEDARREAWLCALALTALVNIKQESVALAMGVAVGGLAVAATLQPTRRREGLPLLLAAALPAAFLYFGWRWYVLSHFAAGELKPVPMVQWNLQALPLILSNMAKAIGGKGVFYATLGASFVIFALSLRQRGRDMATRIAGVLVGVFLVYNAALIVAYVALFPGEMGTDAHSYFRYSTHLSLLLMLTLVLQMRPIWQAEWPAAVVWKNAGQAALALALVASPVAFLSYLRFDLEEPQLRVRELAHEAASHLAGDKLGLLLPGDNGSVATVLETALRVLPPRRAGVELKVLNGDVSAGLADFTVSGFRSAVISCTPRDFDLAPPGHGAFLVRDEAGWHATAVWSYAPPPAGARWSTVLAEKPLCL